MRLPIKWDAWRRRQAMAWSPRHMAMAWRRHAFHEVETVFRESLRKIIGRILDNVFLSFIVAMLHHCSIDLPMLRNTYQFTSLLIDQRIS